MKSVLLLLVFLTSVALAAKRQENRLLGSWFYTETGSGILLELRADDTFRITTFEFSRGKADKLIPVKQTIQSKGRWKVSGEDRIILRPTKGMIIYPGKAKDIEDGHKFRLTNQKIHGKTYQGLMLDFLQDMPLQRIGPDTLKELEIERR